MSEPKVEVWRDRTAVGAPCFAAVVQSGELIISLSQLNGEAPDWYVDALSVARSAPPLFQNGMGERRRSQRVYQKAPIVVELNQKADALRRSPHAHLAP